MSDVIQVEELFKAYGSLPVLQGLSLRVRAGEVYGLLGPNGAGKSTLIHLMMGFLRPNQGQLRLFGSTRLERMRARIGYIPERQRYHTRYNAREYLRFLGQFSGLAGAALHERVERELIAVGLRDAAERSLGTYSKGMLQRLGVAQALLCDPDLLLIDEPTSGLDPAGQREVIELLASVRERGHTVFLCTHYLQEVEVLCDRVGVLAGGRIAAETSTHELRDVASSVRISVSPLGAELQAQIAALGPGVRCEERSVRLSPNSAALQAAVLQALLDARVAIIALEPLESPLERLYREAVHEMLPSPGEAHGLPAALWDLPLPGEQPPPAPADGRRGEGDTLLNELLGRNDRDQDPGERTPGA